MRQIKFGSYAIALPASRLARILIGAALIIGGLFAFLPILGVWMIPLGLIVLSVDFPVLRRKRREWTVKYGPKFKERFPRLATMFGFRERRAD